MRLTYTLVVVLSLGIVHLATSQYSDLTNQVEWMTPKQRWLNSDKGQNTIVHDTKNDNLLNQMATLPVDENGNVAKYTLRDGGGDISVSINTIPFAQLKFVTDTIVFGLDASRNVWITNDAFFTWSKTPINQTDRVRGIFPSPADKNTIFFLGSMGRGENNASWVTQDLGKTYKRIPTSLPMQQFLWHPTKVGWALATTGSILYATYDFGATWTSIRDRLTFATWCHAGKDGVPETRVCMIADVDPEDLGLSSGTTDERVGPSRFVRTEDLGNTIEVVFALEVSYLIVHKLFFFVIATDPSTGTADLFVSNDHGDNWKNADLPAGLSIPYLYPNQLLDDSTGALWIGVNHQSPIWGSAMGGTLYISDTDGFKFAAVLENVVNLNNWWDFEPVHSLDGVYIANIMASWTAGDQGNNLLEEMIATRITYDNGRSWHHLKAPLYDSNGVPINCTGCHLNLFGITTWLGIGGDGYFGNFYTDKKAIGMILATGNVGTILDFDKEDVNSYMSRDGGLSWSEISKGSTVYEFGDHGGILVIVPNQQNVYSILYSVDEGATWTSLNISTPNKPFYVVNLFTAAVSGETFVLFGYYQGAITYMAIDFSQFRETTCNLPADYEQWSPRDSRNATGSCVLGRNTVYWRRIRTAPCFNPDDFNQTYSVVNCNCTEEDYECDYGYETTYQSELCVKVMTPEEEASYINMQCADPANSNNYAISTGYRVIPGDSCVSPLAKYYPTWTACAQVTGSSTSTAITSSDANHGGVGGGTVALIVAGFILITIAALILGIVLGARNQKLQELVSRTASRTNGEQKYAPVFMDDDIEDEPPNTQL